MFTHTGEEESLLFVRSDTRSGGVEQHVFKIAILNTVLVVQDVFIAFNLDDMFFGCGATSS